MAIYPPPGITLSNKYQILQHICVAFFFPIRKENYRAVALIKAFKTLGDHNLQKRISKFAAMAASTHLACKKRQPNQKFALADAWMTPLITSMWMDLVERMTPDEVFEVVVAYWKILRFENMSDSDIPDVDKSWGLDTRGFVSA